MGRAHGSSAIALAMRISAERRWILTGTPLPTAVPRASLRHLLQVSPIELK